MNLYTTDTESMTKNANLIKEVVLKGLQKEGFLTKPATEIGERYAVVLHRRGWLGDWWDKWFAGLDKECFRITFVKIVEE